MKIGNIHNIMTPEFIERCRFQAKQFNLRGRTPEEVLKHTIHGEAVEVLVCSYFGFTQVPFEIKEYDAISSEGNKIEIKHTVKNDKWWNFSRENYNYFFQNSPYLDRIILCYLDLDTGDVFLKFSACARTFPSTPDKAIIIPVGTIILRMPREIRVVKSTKKVLMFLRIRTFLFRVLWILQFQFNPILYK